MKLIYVAHVYGGLMQNSYKAEYWTAWLNERINGAFFICPWLPQVRHWVDSGESRARGMTLNLEAVRMFDGLIALTALAGGVRDEWELATNKIAEFTQFGGEPDIDRIQRWVNQLPSEMVAAAEEVI